MHAIVNKLSEWAVLLGAVVVTVGHFAFDWNFDTVVVALVVAVAAAVVLPVVFDSEAWTTDTAVEWLTNRNVAVVAVLAAVAFASLWVVVVVAVAALALNDERVKAVLGV